MTTMPVASAASSTLVSVTPGATYGPQWSGPVAWEVGALPMSRLKRVTTYIQEHLDQELTLAQLGSVVYMSPFHFARLFQRSTGLPPHRFVVRTRVDRAASLLADSELTIASIARAVGFRTASHFSTVFRRFMGVTPRAYRAQRLEARGQEARDGRV